MNKKKLINAAKESIVRGIFWSIGVTIGFAIVSAVLIGILSNINTLPIIGNFLANVVEQTQKNLESR